MPSGHSMEGMFKLAQSMMILGYTVCLLTVLAWGLGPTTVAYGIAVTLTSAWALWGLKKVNRD